MRNRVSPNIEQARAIPPCRMICGIPCKDLAPKVDEVAIEVGPKIAGIGIAGIQFPPINAFIAKYGMKSDRMDRVYQSVRTFGMQVAAITLKFRTQQDHIGTNVVLYAIRIRRMQTLQMKAIAFKIVQSRQSNRLPSDQCVGGHGDTRFSHYIEAKPPILLVMLRFPRTFRQEGTPSER